MSVLLIQRATQGQRRVGLLEKRKDSTEKESSMLTHEASWRALLSSCLPTSTQGSSQSSRGQRQELTSYRRSATNKCLHHAQWKSVQLGF